MLLYLTLHTSFIYSCTSYLYYTLFFHGLLIFTLLRVPSYTLLIHVLLVYLLPTFMINYLTFHITYSAQCLSSTRSDCLCGPFGRVNQYLRLTTSLRSYVQSREAHTAATTSNHCINLVEKNEPQDSLDFGFFIQISRDSSIKLYEI